MYAFMDGTVVLKKILFEHINKEIYIIYTVLDHYTPNLFLERWIVERWIVCKTRKVP